MKITDKRSAFVTCASGVSVGYAVNSDFTENLPGSVQFRSDYNFGPHALTSKTVNLPAGSHLVLAPYQTADVKINGVASNTAAWMTVTKTIDTYKVSPPLKQGDIVTIGPKSNPNP